MFKCPPDTVDKVYHLYWRFFPCTMFLFRGENMTVVTDKDTPKKIEPTNRVITHHRTNFDAGVKVLCTLSEIIFGPMGCTPNLHSLHHMIRQLIHLKGPTFEMIVERLVIAANINLVNLF